MNNREKILNITHYILIAESNYLDELERTENLIKIRSRVYAEDYLNYYKAKIKLETYKEISNDIERLLFDNYGS